MLFSRLDRYIFIRSLIGLLIALGGISFAIILVDLVEQMRAVSGVQNANFGTALYFTLLRLPGLIEKTTPVTILIAAVLTFTGLSRSSQIIAMRAAGISAWRFLAPLGTLAVTMGAFVVLVIGPSASSLNKKYEDIKTKLTSNLITSTDDKSKISWTTIPTNDGHVIISGIYSRLNPTNEIYKNAIILQYDRQGTEFLQRIDAQIANITNQEIEAQNVIISKVGTITQSSLKYKIHLNKNSRDVTANDPNILALWELPDAAKKAQEAGGSPEKYWLRFYRLLALPVTMLAMALFAALMSIGLDRSGGKLKSVFIGIVGGLIMYFSNDLAGILTLSGVLPHYVAALAPPLLSLSSVLAILSYREDGNN